MNVSHLRVVVALGLVSVLAHAEAADKSKTVTKMQVVDKKDLGMFSGTIESLDTTLRTVTLKGHQVVIRELKPVKVPDKDNKDRDDDKSKDKKRHAGPPPVSRTFKVDGLCKIVKGKDETAELSDLKVGDRVEITYHAGLGGDNIATEIRPAQTHKDVIEKDRDKGKRNR